MAQKKTTKTTVVTEKKTAVVAPTRSGGALFERENLILMGIGLAVIALGMFLMAGGKSPDPAVFKPEEVYSTRRITIAPILIILGLVIEVIAIFRKPRVRAV